MIAQGYRLTETLHQGRSSTVYRAVRSADQQPVILKVLDATRSRPRDLDGLRNEYELGRTLTGAAVIAPLALTTFEGLPALELADFDGRSLEALAGTPMSVPSFLPLAVRIAAAVAGVHARGVIHKDLKPGNILVDRDGEEVRLTDFGIASRVAREQTTARPTRLIEGSLPYVSPEQTGRMNRALDSRSDLYSLGVTLFQLLTGRLPFEAADPIGWVHCHVASTPPSPSELRPDLPAALSAIVLKLLAKVPDDRYQTAAGLERDLERCSREWQQSGRVTPFVLGEHDVSDRFLIPQKLYGRADPCAALVGAFERVAASGTCELVMVSGYSGIGKSAVVHELHRPVADRRGLFLAGKFEQYKRDIPYHTVILAFRELVLDILADREEEIAACRQRLAAALGSNGQLIVDLIPPVGVLLGPQPTVPELPLAEAEARLRLVLRQFITAFASHEQPLTLFLDDLQWADAASLKLIVDLMAAADVRHLLIVGAYRSNEVDRAHPLARAIDEVRAGGAVVNEVVLGPLGEPDIGQLVAETLHCSPAEAAPLARLVCEKTGGNPFFAIHFLTVLYRQGLLAFDRDDGRWCWDVAQIRAQGYTDNVVELMVGKLRELPGPTQNALQLAAAIGATVDADALALVLESDAEAVLRPALEEDLLLRLERAYRFPHDRVQEAAYALIPEHARAATHLRIGRLLLAHTPREQLEEKCFELASQLNRGGALIASRDERERVAELDLVAGRRAHSSAAYASALTYLAAGSALLGEDAWDRRHDLCFALELHRAQCEYLTGELDAAEARLATVSRRARTLEEVAAVTSARTDLYTARNRSDRAVEVCLEYLRHIGVEWSAHPTRDEVGREFDRMWSQLGDRPIEALLRLPRMTDPAARATIEVLMWAHPPAQFTDENLSALVIARMVNLSLEHGNSDASGLAYVWLGALLGSMFDNHPAGYRFGKVGLELAEKRGLLRFQSRVYVIFGALVSPWAAHFRAGLPLIRRAFDTAAEACDITYGCYARNAFTTLLLAAGDPLGEVQRETESALHFVRKAKFGLMIDIITSKLRLLRKLRGLTPDDPSFDDPQFDARYEQHQEADQSIAISACWYFIRQMQERYYAGDHGAAVASAARAEALLWTSPSFVEAAEYHFYAALARAAHYDDAPPSERPAHREALLAHQRQIDAWAENCPENFADRAALIGAEIARIDGDVVTAEARYEHAIRCARANSLVHDEALAFETAARFYGARGFTVFADAYLREARGRYLRWGAEGKVRWLEQQYPQLAEHLALGPAATMALRPDQLDLLAVVKASQTISGAVTREPLLRTLLQVVLEGSGARRARLVLVRDGELELAATAGPDEVASPARASPVAAVPVSILQYVQRTHERVLLHDATVDAERFARDEYLARAQPRSVLCLPIRRESEVVALIYLENELVPGAFTPERLLTLELLAAQAAISLENLLLLEREHAGRIEAEAASQRALLLAEATALISSTTDYHDAFTELTRLCVRSFADWAVIDLLDATEVVRVAGEHRDPTKAPILRELEQRYPARLGTHAPAALVLQDGVPRLHSSFTDEDIRSYAVDEEHARLIAQLGTRSGIAVPLVARGTRLGALTFGAESRDRFGAADLEFAGELARRAALAIDNARLLHETREALRLRDEFLTVASHELRTPVTSLRLTVETLLQSAEMGKAASPERTQRALQRVLSKTERLQQLTTDLLDVTRIEHGRLELRPAEVDLASVVRNAAERFELELAAARCALTIVCAGPVVGTWDASRLDQVISNLLSNAIKFGPGRPIRIGLEKVGEVARLTVTDHGIGIAPADQPHVFERFGRAASWRHYGGLGLGLYITRWIVLAHQGRIHVESTPGEGATFIVELPCFPQAARNDEKSFAIARGDEETSVPAPRDQIGGTT